MTRERRHKERLTFNISRARVFYVPIILPPSRELILLPIIARKGGSLKNLSIAAAAAKETRASSSFHARQNANGRGMKLLFHASQPQSDAIYGAADCKSCLPSCACNSAFRNTIIVTLASWGFYSRQMHLKSRDAFSKSLANIFSFLLHPAVPFTAIKDGRKRGRGVISLWVRA